MFRYFKRALCIMAVVFQFFCINELTFASQNSAVSSNDAIPVRVKIGMILDVEFPEKIANVTKSLSSDFIQIETLGNKMFLLPLKDLDTLIYVVTQDDISYCLHLIMDDAQSATRLKIRKPQKSILDPQSREIINTVELMKTIMSGRQPDFSVSTEFYKYEIYNNGKFRMLADKVYQLQGGAKALVLTFENLMAQPIVLPLENIEIPGLLAISVDNQMLEAMPRRNTHDTNNANYSTKAYMIIQEPGL